MMERTTEDKKGGALEVVHKQNQHHFTALDVQPTGEVGLVAGQGGYDDGGMSIMRNAEELRAVAAKMTEVADRLEGK